MVARKAHTGFTLIEITAGLMVMSVMAGIAAPSFRDFTSGQRIKATSFDLFADLTYARSEAIKSNSEVIISKATGGWKNGWTITWVDGGGTTRTLRSQPALSSSLAVTGTQDLLKFERNGRLLAGTPTAKFTLTDASGRQSIPTRCVAIDPSGRPRSTMGACT